VTAVRRCCATLDETTLIIRLKQRQQAALAEVIDRYAAYVGTIVRNAIGDFMKAEDVEEVVADAFALLWHHAERLQESSPLKPYLAAIARNQARKKLRGYDPRLNPLDDDMLVVEGADDALAHAERKQLLEWALSQMGETDREIFIRYYYYMEKTAAIAARLGMKEATVRSRLSRGRDSLRQLLTERGARHEHSHFRPV